MRSSNCATRPRRSPWRRSSCNFTSIICRAGKAPASCAPSQPTARTPAARRKRLRMPDAPAEAIRSAAMTAADIHAAILAAWRIEQPRLITSLSRMLRDVPLAEELTQDTLVAALEDWPKSGLPERPGAWLMATAKRRALDQLRRGKMLARKHGMLAVDFEREEQAMPDFDASLDDDIGDEMLRLIFTACHPLLSRDASAALALRMICGLTTEEIARAFLVE